MRIGSPLFLAALLAGPLTSLAAGTNAPATFKDDREKAAYAVGVYFGNMMKGNNFDLDADVVSRAMKDVLSGHELKLSNPEAQVAIREYQTRRQQEVIDKNKMAGDLFLVGNKSKPGVLTCEVALPDGTTNEFQYRVLAEGAGETAKMSDVVKITFHGKLLDGKDIPAPYGSGEAVELPVTRTPLRGMAEALQRMKVGSKWQLYLPASLAFGARGAPNVEPGSTITMELELLSAQAPPPPPAQPVSQPLTSDIIRVPSAEEMKAGQKIQVIKADEVDKQAATQNSQSKTNKK